MHSTIQQRLQRIRETHCWREEIAISVDSHNRIYRQHQALINFSSNDYLGLSQHPTVKRAAIRAINQYGVGATASQLVCGYTKLHHRLEQFLKEVFEAESALIMSSGYAANLAIHECLAEPNSTLLHDRLNHASLLQGAIHSKARLYRFQHKDMQGLVQLAKRHSPVSMIVSDGVFSMDGDIADIKALNHVAERHNSYLVIDDAHGVGVLAEGYGSLAKYQIKPQNHCLLVVTFGKALGSSGAAILGDQAVIDYLRQKAKNHIYTTALAPSLVAATLSSLEIALSQEGQALRQTCQENINYFQKTIEASIQSRLIASETPIQPILMGNEKLALRCSEGLKQATRKQLGLLVIAIRPPTVPKHTSRLRIVINANHSQQQIDALTERLNSQLQDS